MDGTAQASGPLEGISVLDISTMLAAPIAATILGDFGADVLKVEEPGRGDFPRWPSPVPGGVTPMWAQEGRNKRSVTLDLRQATGRLLAHRLIARTDVLIVNFRPERLEEWGLVPEDLCAANPALVVLAVSGYGATGPYRNRGSFDRIASAYSGHTYVSGPADGAPVRGGFAVIDYMTAYLGAFSVLAALRHRDRTGEGQVIDLALYEAAFRATEGALVGYSHTGFVRDRLGSRNPFVVPACETAAGDGKHVAYHAGTPALFARLAEAIGRADLLEDDRFATPHGRLVNQVALYKIVDGWVASVPAAEVVETLTAVDVPASIVMSVADIAADPHYIERETFVAVEHEDLGPLLMPAPVPRLSRSPGSIRNLGPRIGSSNRDVYVGELGLDDSEYAALEADGVI